MEKISKLEVSEQEVAETFEPPVPELAPKPSRYVKPTVKFPAEKGDLGRSNEQATEILSLWSELMNLTDVELSKRGGILELQLQQDYGVKTVNALRNKQAGHMLDQLIAAIKAEKAKSTQQEKTEPADEPPAPAATEEDIADAERGGMKAA